MASFSDLSGQIIDGRYRLREFLGQGAFGCVFSADEIMLGEVVGRAAVKLVRPPGAARRADVLHEVRALAGVSHPHLLSYRSAGEVRWDDAHFIYLATELGQSSLDEAMKTRALNRAGLVQLARELGLGLRYLAERDRVHRDLKPANVLKVNGVWKIADFGLSRVVSPDDLQRTGAAGTVIYMAPETCEGVIGPPLDVWALGVLLQQYLCGAFPYTPSEQATFFRALQNEAPFIAPNLPAPFDAIINGCLQKDPRARWTPDQVLHALDASAVAASAAIANGTVARDVTANGFDAGGVAASPPANIGALDAATPSALSDGSSSASLVLARPAKLGLWRGARRRGETGIEVAEGFCAFSAWEVPAIPDFSSARFPDLSELDAAERVQRVAAGHAQLLAALHPLGENFGCSLRYRFERREDGEARIRLFLVGRCFDFSPAQAKADLAVFDEIVERDFPREYRRARLSPDDEAWQDIVDLQNVSALSELLKPEQTIPAWHERALCGFDFWYHPVAFGAAENDMIGVLAALARQTMARRVCLDLTLIPAPPLTATERDEVASWTTLAERWGREQRIQVGGGLYSDAHDVQIAPDPRAGDIKKACGELLQRYGNPQNRCFLYAVRAFAFDDAASGAETATLALRSWAARALPPEQSANLCALDAAHPAFVRAVNAARAVSVSPAVCNAQIWSHPDAPETLRRLHRLADVKELSSLFRLPIAGRDGCPGMALDAGLPSPSPAPVRAGKTGGVSIGRFIEGIRVSGEEASFELNDLNKHALIVGTPGSGKTTLCFSLLRQLWQDHGVPFIVLEPAKTEYRSLIELPGLRDELLAFTVGNERIAPFRFNPFEIMDGVPVAEHISALNTCFSGAFNLWDPLPMILDEATRDIYAERGWSEYGVGGDEPDLEPPTFADLHRRALEIAVSSSYKGETAGNIRGAIETRLGSLLRGPKGRCFNTRRSIPFDLMMQRPVVLELDALNDDEKALMMMFLLVAVREHAKANRRSGSPLKHVVLVEEAHNVIGRGEGGGGDNKANPKEVAVKFFTRMLAEMRALGEGIIIADQLPTAIAPEAIKNTNIKVMHRVVAVDDRQELGGAMIFDGAQMEAAALQPAGHSLVFMEGWARSRAVQEPNFKLETGLDEPQDDATLRAQMQPFEASPAMRAAFLPFDGCAASCSVCDKRVREQNERFADKKKPAVAALLARDPTASPFREYLKDLPFPGGDKVRDNCALVHGKEWFGARK